MKIDEAADQQLESTSDLNANSNEPSSSGKRALQTAFSLLQLLAVSLCIEMLLGISNGEGLLLRLFLMAVVMFCIVLRWGWLVLVAFQFSLLLQEPGNWQVQFSPGVLWVVVALLATIVAMKLPQTHRLLSEVLLEASGVDENQTETESLSKRTWLPIAMQIVQVLLVVAVAAFLTPLLPIGPQTNRWLTTSVRSGQAFWPGAIWLVAVVACFVLAREAAWRMIKGRQARLYLRSVNLIANYRDLARFEKARIHWLRTEQPNSIPPTSEPTTRNTTEPSANKASNKAKQMNSGNAMNQSDLRGMQ